MAVQYIVTTSSSSSGFIELIHGTDLASANNIEQKGLSVSGLMATPGAYAFCTTTERFIAHQYATIKASGIKGKPALVTFTLPLSTIQQFMMNGQDWVRQEEIDKAYEFHPVCFEEINRVWTNVSVEVVSMTVIT